MHTDHQHPTSWVIVLITWCFALAGAAPALAHQKLTAYRTAKVDLRSDADRETVQAIATHMDQSLDGYRQELGVGSRTGAGRPLVYLFAEEGAYQRHLRGLGLDGRGSGGMFYFTPKETALALPLGESSRTRILEVVQHEGFHQFAHATFKAGLPTWLNEGLAEYFGDALVRRGRFTAGLIPATRLDHLRQANKQGKLISLSKLTSLDGRSWAAALRSGESRTLYEQAWSVVYFLKHGDGDATSRRFDRLLSMMAQGRSYSESLRAAFGPSGLTSYEQRWLRAITKDLEPDAFSTTRDRVLFTAEALRWLQMNAPDQIPSNFENLGEMLKRRHFTTTTSAHGVQVVRRASDPRYFPGADAGRQMPRPANLELLKPAGKDLPPGISAVGVWPRIKLTWSRDKQGRLVDHLSYD